MSREVVAVVGPGGEVLRWSAGAEAAVPDDRGLWECLWAARAGLLGVAHSHPGAGPTTPSSEDLSTFAACEAGLGRRLRWWIATQDAVIAVEWTGPGRTDYGAVPPGPTPWLDELRRRSGFGLASSPGRTP
jgi:hypothetical protein